MKKFLTYSLAFTLGAACAFGYFHLQNAENAEKIERAYNDGYSAGVIATSLGALQESIRHDVANLKKHD